MFFNFGALQNFSDIFEVVTFFLLNYRNAYDYQTFQVVTSFEELSPIDMNDISI